MSARWAELMVGFDAFWQENSNWGKRGNQQKGGKRGSETLVLGRLCVSREGTRKLLAQRQGRERGYERKCCEIVFAELSCEHIFLKSAGALTCRGPLRIARF